MKVFVTGATGFVGSAVVADLLSSGHQVLGLARSDAAADRLIAARATVHRGDLMDVGSLTSGAAACDGVIHTGFIHDFARFQEVCDIDAHAIRALGAALAGTAKPLVVTAGIALVASGRLAVESDAGPVPSEAYPRQSERVAADLAAQGIHVSVVRLSPSVHGEGDYGFVPMLIALAREKGVSAYIGTGDNRWAAVARHDAAALFRRALEKGAAGATYHGVTEQGIAFRDIAQAIGHGLGLPVVSVAAAEAAGHFGWFTGFAGLDCPASSDWTQSELTWTLRGTGLLADMNTGNYFKS